jgi:ArsR family transcriptional regulator, arsenate/arsenite/antimonite-responsive transcriptional repressor
MNSGLVSAPDLFRAFADATRLRILNLLLEGELCVCDLCELLEEVQPKVSRHLAYLRRAGLVTVRQHGKWKFYAVPDRPAAPARTLLDCVGSCLRQLDELTRDIEHLQRLPKRNVCA